MRGIGQYQSVALESSDQRQLVVLCFEALLRRQNSAVEAFAEERFRDAVEHLRIAREIYCELLLGLEHDAAPDLSTSLASLYDFCIRELAAAGQDLKSERLTGTLRVTQQLYAGFKEAFSGEEVPE